MKPILWYCCLNFLKSQLSRISGIKELDQKLFYTVLVGMDGIKWLECWWNGTSVTQNVRISWDLLHCTVLVILLSWTL